MTGVSGHQHAPAAIYRREIPGTYCTGGWVDPGPVWTGGKSRTHRDSIPDRPAVVSRYADWATRSTFS